MGTRQTDQHTQNVDQKPKRCSLCKKPYSPACEYMQGRCPHHPSMISTKIVQTRIQNIINFFKGK